MLSFTNVLYIVEGRSNWNTQNGFIPLNGIREFYTDMSWVYGELSPGQHITAPISVPPPGPTAGRRSGHPVTRRGYVHYIVAYDPVAGGSPDIQLYFLDRDFDEIDAVSLNEYMEDDTRRRTASVRAQDRAERIAGAAVPALT